MNDIDFEHITCEFYEPVMQLWRDSLCGTFSYDENNLEGSRSAYAQNGVEYSEVKVYNYCRPYECSIIAYHLFHSLYNEVERVRYKCSRGLLYWRIAPEFSMSAASLVTKVDPDGPEVDHLTDMRCHKDHGWFLIEARARCAPVYPRIPQGTQP